MSSSALRGPKPRPRRPSPRRNLGSNRPPREARPAWSRADSRREGSPPRREPRPDGGGLRPSGRPARGGKAGESPVPVAEDRGERLQKFLARGGVASRRECEALITGGRVQVNGRIVTTLGTRVRPGQDHIQVDGQEVRTEGPVTIMLHKPAGYITSLSDPQGRPVVMSLLPSGEMPRLFPVGRLDWDTEGLLLLTNDGELAHLLTHPRHRVRKVYRAKLKGHVSFESLARLLRGVLCDGERLSADSVQMMHSTRENSWVAIAIEQGRYRQVRRMCEAIGHPVLKLIRVALGPINLGSLPRGQWRPLTPAELGSLQALRKQRP